MNGNDEKWKKLYDENIGKTIDLKRYRDYSTLKYSMRSVYKHVPFDIHWHLIVQDESQIPSFIDKSKVIYYSDESTPGSLRIIYHKDFFPEDATLPSFNSNAIEASFTTLKGINECFIYLNDDFLINSDISIANIFDELGKLYIYKDPKITLESFSNPENYDEIISNSNNRFNKILNGKKDIISFQKNSN